MQLNIMSRVSLSPTAGRLFRNVVPGATIQEVAAIRSRIRATRHRQSRIAAQQTDVVLPASSVAVPKGNWTVLERGVTAPEGFRAAGAYVRNVFSTHSGSLVLQLFRLDCAARGPNQICRLLCAMSQLSRQESSHETS